MYNRKDSYYHKAKQEGYKSRAAYKLLELNQKYKIIKKSDKVLDCGAAPGGWSQVALNLVGGSGLVAACDLVKIEGISAPNFIFMEGDMLEAEVGEKLGTLAKEGYNVVLSDMAPKTTGIKVKDHSGSIELARIALKMAVGNLKSGGNFLVKVFDGEERDAYVKEVRKHFKIIKTIRPDATRKSSFEMYVLATGFVKA